MDDAHFALGIGSRGPVFLYLDDDVNAELSPWELQRVPARDDRDGLAVDADGRVVDDLDIGLEGAEHRVVLEKVRRLESRKKKQCKFQSETQNPWQTSEILNTSATASVGSDLHVRS